MHKILVLDDDENIRILYAAELGEEGYEIIAAGAGPDPLSIVQEVNPDIVVLDERLRRQGGLDVVAEVRRRWDSLPIIVTTVFPPAGGGKAGSDEDYILKSWNLMARIKAKIKGVLAASVLRKGRCVAVAPLAAAGVSCKRRAERVIQFQDSDPQGQGACLPEASG